MSTKTAQDLIDENEEYELELESQGLETIKKIKKNGITKNASS